MPVGGKSPATGPKGGTLPVQNSPCSPEMAQFGAIYACRESFVSLCSAKHRAGRVLYRTRGRYRASQHNNTPGPTGVKRKAPEEPQDPAAVQAAAGWLGQHRFAGPARVRTTTARQISHVIYLGHFLRPHENVAIPTILIQRLKQRDGNYVRNCSDGGKACSAHIRKHSPAHTSRFDM